MIEFILYYEFTGLIAFGLVLLCKDFPVSLMLIWVLAWPAALCAWLIVSDGHLRNRRLF